jgi:DNA-directed RNA polymerase subunit K/omega
MEAKKTVPGNTITRKLIDLDTPTGNIYESVSIISKRANQISAVLKAELGQKLNEFSTTTDSLEETFENREQIEISRYYERMPKATLIATEEFLNGDIYFCEGGISVENWDLVI